jgi:hypothetical protein
MITYNGIIQYFKYFAQKHMQIQSFTQGTADKIDLLKINDYPVLHIDITNTNIQNQTIVYDVDVYIITAATSDDEGERVDALGRTLLILQDLREEFFDGNIVVPKLLLLRGSEELSCTPIQEDFNNRVYGWSTSISVTGVNEATRCTIPYPPQSVTETWEGTEWIAPFESDLFRDSVSLTSTDMYWWSASEKFRSSVAYGSGSSVKEIQHINSIKDGSWLVSDLLVPNSNEMSANGQMAYIEEEQAIRFYGLPSEGNTSYYLGGQLSSSLDNTGTHLYFAFTIKNIKLLGTDSCSLFQIYSSGQSDGMEIYIGGSSSGADKHNSICLRSWNASYNSAAPNKQIGDGSAEYLREEPITIGISIAGSDVSGGDNFRVRLVYFGAQQNTVNIAHSTLTNFNFGNNKTAVATNGQFDLMDAYACRITGSSKFNDFIKVTNWMHYRNKK